MPRKQIGRLLRSVGAVIDRLSHRLDPPAEPSPREPDSAAERRDRTAAELPAERGEGDGRPPPDVAPGAPGEKSPARRPTDPGGTVVWNRPPASPAAPPASEPTIPFRAGDGALPRSRTPHWLVILEPGELFDERYRVEEEISREGGEAQIFRCTDRETGETVALKLYLWQMKADPEKLALLTNVKSEGIVKVLRHGECRGHFYEIQEFCEGGTLLQAGRLTEEQIEGYLPRMVAGLESLHRKDIVHRDIKPHNFFFRDEARKDLVLGDFGISSLLEVEETHRTTSNLDGTLPFMAPEVFLDGNVGTFNDYFSLGLVLLELLGERPAGSGPLPQLAGPVPLPDGVSDRMRHLLWGLLKRNPETRWGAEQIGSWLRNEPVRVNGQIDEIREEEWVKIPYAACKQADTPRKLALHLHEFDAEGDLFRGYIRDWLALTDRALAARVDELSEEYAGRGELAVFRLRCLLDPSLPLPLAGRDVYELHDLERALDMTVFGGQAQEDLRRACLDAVFEERLESWLEIRFPGEPAIGRIRARIGEIRQRFGDPGDRLLGCLALLSAIAPECGLPLGTEERLGSPGEIDRFLEEHPAAEQTLAERLDSRYLETWIEFSSPELAQEAQAVEAIRREHADDDELRLRALRWRFAGRPQFDLGGFRAADPPALARQIDADDERTATAIGLLERGAILAWLRHGGWLAATDLEQLASILAADEVSPPRKLEALLHVLDEGLEWPEAAADADRIDFGPVQQEASMKRTLRIFNRGRGHLSGSLSLVGRGGGFRLDKQTFEGRRTDVEVSINPRGIALGSTQEARLVATPEGRNGLEIPLSYRVMAPWWAIIRRTALWGAIYAAVLGVVRFGLDYAEPYYGIFSSGHWLTFAHVTTSAWGWIVILLFLLLGVGISVWIYYFWNMVEEL